MLKSFFKFIKNIFREKSVYERLDDYIASGNPKNSGDVERLEKEFFNRERSIRVFDRYY